MSEEQEKRQAEIRNKLNSNIQQQMTQRNFPFYQGMLLKAGAGSVLGYCSGIFAKQISNIVIWWSGIATVFLGWLHWTNYITINFKKIDADVFHLIAKVQKNEQMGTFRNLKKMITHVLPLLGGFSASFWAAFDGHHH